MAWPVAEPARGTTAPGQGAGTWDYQWPGEEAGSLREAVEGVCYWACDGSDETPGPLRLDEQNLQASMRRGFRCSRQTVWRPGLAQV